MGIFDDADWPGLTFNPAKGDLHTIQSLAYDVKTVGDELDELRQMLVTIGRTDGAWEGEAAQKFQQKVGELPKYLQQGHESMNACSQALKSWHSELETMQRQAKSLEAEAVEVRKQLEQRNDAVDQVNSKIAQSRFRQLTQQEADALTEEADSASRAAQDAASHLERVIENGEALRKYWEEQAAKAEKAIREAAENRPPDISIWDKITDGLKGAWDGFKDFLIDNADLFSTISAALAAAAIIVNVVPIGGQVASAILGAGSVAFAGAAMAGHWMGGAPMWKVGLDALGVIPGVGGAAKGLFVGGKALLTGGRVASGVTAGAKTMIGQITNPMSTKAITWGLSKFGKQVDPALITVGVKGFSTGFGLGHLLGGGDGGGTGTPPVSTQPAPVTPGSPEDRLLDSSTPPVRTMPYPAATGDKFHHTLAA
ncbi:putative T7SS-secreted protein [Streptomyces griseoviridis]|jgi:uncharacterized protein YukE|uniref:Uncharacterized coiled-coil DUF342 family protein n=3 Tax=Streptomyces TaxID=1883 RepID=A0ABT9LLM4_STRGD|nr:MULTISPECIES: hypothetical protein [Streptomyces]MDP9684427.1 uncharacterized coiled-coil DUF342 family protein [Streptomyces griseoviridis]GGS68318.1 hypothetical protein GCM10010238_66260 [Streptomyces niveoruber]GGT22684.1 hypothetical protein GCM10010240_64270 [Streptomyces griseoviridis]GGU64710.1 hypothetical protein GCM10010259_64050 [Streptomyces daghestanicus]GHI30611.1 hypothetical protein Sdagh_23410 [Streptomyces daghestanicus]